ncbi:twin-arginine translocation pathway signal [Mycolicibacterium sphagni]|uniref:Twin-arginine translocation pathway signal n=1 Tax=Mycolicibacterium sphagni TaxID=1786 RepID=A0ABX2K3J6_9MYCO|nr:twin-arginine translocation pathway signal [Mycolicibacterium sphagni]NTY63762.1 twin-arginine translocation pathway signal [Mycolicibacterium sphagni]
MSSEDKDADATEVDITESGVTELDVADEVNAEKTGEIDESADAQEVDEVEIPGEAFQGRRSVGRLVAIAVLAVLLVGSAAGAASVYWWMFRPDQKALGLNLFTTASVDQQIQERQKQVAGAARDGTVALLSYAPETLDKDLANAKSHLTGEFLKYYSQFTDQIVAPAARQKGVKTEATVARAAVSELHADSAVVLVFVNQVTTSKDRPDPALATSSVVVKLTNTDGHWLISEFNPV